METTPPAQSNGGTAQAGPALDPYRLFVGRERELDVTVRAFEDARVARGRLLFLAGEPGIGKTRLADELGARATETGAAVLWGRCWEAGGAPPFWPWIQCLREFVRSLENEELRAALDGGASEMAQLLPELKERFPDLPDLPPAPPDAARFRLFEAVGGFLRRASQERPMVLILEDLHSADAPSLLLLRFVGDGLDGSRVLLVGTYRDVDMQPDQALSSMLPDLVRVRGAARLTLSGLAAEEIPQLVQAISGQTPSERLVTEIHHESEGNPLFVREIVQLLSSEGRLSDNIDPREWGVPEGIREVIGRRLDRVSEQGKQTLTVASVLGRDFTVEALEQVLDRSPTQVLETLQDGLVARVIVEVPGSPGRFRFSHSLMRETLYEELAPAERVRLHRKAGESLEALYASDDEPYLAELAHHFFEAAPGGDVDKAVDYARRGGERAIALLAYEEAVLLFRKALAALQRSPNEEVRCLLLLALGDALARAGETPAAQQAFLEAAATATRLNLPELLARAAVGYGGRFIFARAGTDPHVIPLLEQALAALGPGDSTLRVLVLSRLAGALRDQPSIERRDALSREAVDIARRIGDSEMLMHALDGRAGVALRADGLEEQLALADELSRVAQEVGDRERLMDACWIRFVHFMVEGQVAEARTQLEMGSRLADEVGQPSQRWIANMLATCLALHDGRLMEAEELIERTLRLGRGAEQWWAGASSLFGLFVLRREQGRLAELQEELHRAVEEYPSYRSFRCIVLVSLCEMGQFDEARRLFDRLAVDSFGRLPKDNEWLSNMTLLTEVAEALDDRARAATLYDLLGPYAGQVALVASDVSLGPVHRPLGILATLTGRPTGARRHFEASVEMCERMEARPWLAHSLYQLGRLLVGESGKDREGAVELLRRALEICEATGMTALQEKVVGLLAKFGQGARRPGGRAGRAQTLTPREEEVATLVAEGLSNRQIADRLFVSERTVETHVQNILMKLGFKSRTQGATWVLSEGLRGQST